MLASLRRQERLEYAKISTIGRNRRSTSEPGAPLLPNASHGQMYSHLSELQQGDIWYRPARRSAPSLHDALHSVLVTFRFRNADARLPGLGH